MAEGACLLGRLGAAAGLWVRDHVRATYASPEPCGRVLESHAPALAPRHVAALVPELAERCARYLEHRFDLLGSDWQVVRHNVECRGFEGRRYRAPFVRSDADGEWLDGQVSPPNLAAARAAWRLLDRGYRPVDWHLDFRSGYRWSPRTWYLLVPYGHLPGVDVKVPWELARMQHLPQMALAFGCARAGLPRFLPPERYRDEFRNQVLDFVATNPPRYGVNWRSAMEVSIRAANWLLTHDLFRAYGAEFDSGFDAVFARSVREHGRHVAGNLERTPLRRNNHYLANLAGLIFIAAYLAQTRESARWWRTAVAALDEEIETQFLPDGGHFEASTGYHALAAQLATWAVAMICAKDRGQSRSGVEPDGAGAAGRLRESLQDRLGRMAEFLVDVTRPNGLMVQIGDHDGGRLFKLQPLPRCSRRAPEEPRPDAPAAPGAEPLASGPVVAGINGLLRRADLGRWCGGRWLDEPLVAGLTGRAPGRSSTTPPVRTRAERAASELQHGFPDLCRRLRTASAFDSSRATLAAPGASLLDGLHARAYPDFGAYVFRSDRLFLCLRAGCGCGDGTGGHAHVDQLSLEVAIDGRDWIRDPGSYVYTPCPRQRDAYRSSTAHFVPYVLDGEAGLWRRGLFDLPLDVRVLDVAAGRTAIALDLVLEGNRIGQIVTIGAHEIVVETRMLQRSRTTGPYARCRPGHAGVHEFRGRAMPGAVRFSPGYGVQCDSRIAETRSM